MRFRSLRVSNLRAVRLFELEDLKDFIVVAGPNGCGKSCIFDAIRLLKSVYGGYAQDEHMHWLAEFAINPQSRDALRPMFRDTSQPVEITATIEYSEAEATYLLANSSDLVWPIAWQRVTGQRMDPWTFNRMAIATQMGHFKAPVEQQVFELSTQLQVALSASRAHRISLEVSLDGTLQTSICIPAEVSFQTYEPLHLGVIEYHSASRAYVRQPLQGINLDARAFEDQRRQQSLYNWQAKYQNVKTELATGYLRSLIGSASGAPVGGEDLNETLTELFRTFFPDKVYEGVRPVPGGSLEFPVRLPDGATHDIDDLSSGEKEILYGYLRLRNSTPRQSVILLDEPELHLNPSLLQGFTDFYYRHLGIAQDNQLWLVTHSDTLLRQAIGNANYGVYHMVNATTSVGNQASEVLLDDDVNRVVVDLVGDLAAYRPHAKVVILEGASLDGFDEILVRRLFPDFAKRVNLVCAGPKRRVRDLYAALNEAVSQVGIANRFFAIVDKDAEGYAQPTAGTTEFTWSVYHIENFLLNPAAIRAACRSLLSKELFESDAEVVAALKAQAARLVDSLILEQVRAEVNDEIIRSIAIGGRADGGDIAADIQPSIEGSVDRVVAKGNEYSIERLGERVEALRESLEAAIEADEWTVEFPGRRILARFVSQHLPGVAYEPFRNLVLDNMALAEDRPANMKEVVQRILMA